MIEVYSLKNNTLDSKLAYCVKVCRPSPLGNPYYIGKDGNRDEVCDKYEMWLKERLLESDSPQRLELIRLYNLYKEHGKLKLYCWCSPERCHADFIKYVLLGGLKHQEG